MQVERAELGLWIGLLVSVAGYGVEQNQLKLYLIMPSRLKKEKVRKRGSAIDVIDGFHKE
jgi:hypothetical protein